MEKEDKTDSDDNSDSFFKRLGESIIRNLEITITDVHIRYEDKDSNQGWVWLLDWLDAFP